jgi:multidrug resistance efflux pump
MSEHSPSHSSEADTGWHPPRRGPASAIGIAAIALIAILVILYAWRLWPFSELAEGTDDAYVRGRTTVISPQVNGYVTRLAVQDFDEVKVGQVLATIDDRIYRARVAQGEANVASAKAALRNSDQAQRSREVATRSQDAAIATARAERVRAQADMRRADVLVADGSISQREDDQARATFLAAEASVQQAEAGRAIGTEDVRTVVVNRDQLQAAVEAAQAELRLAQVDLDNTVIRAPVDGRLSELGVRLGAYVTAGTQLMFLVPRDVWVIANFKEGQTRQMRVGQAATFRVDALGGSILRGHIENLAPAAGSEFTVLKPDNATGNFVKIAQRIAVRITVDRDQPPASRLRPGMSVEVRVPAEIGGS